MEFSFLFSNVTVPHMLIYMIQGLELGISTRMSNLVIILYRSRLQFSQSVQYFGKEKVTLGFICLFDATI